MFRMKQIKITIIVSLSVLFFLSGCQEKASKPETAAPQNKYPTVVAKVIYTADAGNYTYVEIEKDGSKYWVAAPKTSIKMGDFVKVSTGVQMKNFKSSALNRTFETILFVDSLPVASLK